MKRKKDIKKDANKFVKRNSFLITDHSNWYVGITGDPEQRHAAHGKPRLWRTWNTGHPAKARKLEKHFLKQGFKGGTGGGTETNYIYIYKRNGPYASF